MMAQMQLSPSFTDGRTEAQRGQVSCPGSPSWPAQSWVPTPSLLKVKVMPRASACACQAIIAFLQGGEGEAEARWALDWPLWGPGVRNSEVN